MAQKWHQTDKDIIIIEDNKKTWLRKPPGHSGPLDNFTHFHEYVHTFSNLQWAEYLSKPISHK